VRDLIHAPLWGLVRSAQSEHPDRFLLIDLDGEEASLRALPTAVATGEPQLAVREGRILVPRLARAAVAPAGDPSWRTDGTVLVTGATGTLGRLVARHLVTEHGVSRLLLTSRSGPDAPGAPELREELAALGAEVTVAACDAADREELAALLASIPAERPLTGVVHAAGVLDDGVLSAVTPDRLARVLRPKVDAAVHLHELTRDLDLDRFVLFSGFAGIIGTAGQSHYAAANTFLDALARHRRDQGLPGLSLTWGFWAERSGMTAHLADADVRRLAGSGVAPLATDEGLALFDAACAGGDSLLMPVRLDLAALRDRVNAAGAAASPVFRELVRARRVAAGGDAASGARADGQVPLRQRLAALTRAEQERAVTELVSAQAAAVLRLPATEGLDLGVPFRDLGFDSLTAVELRNRLGSATDLRLPATLVFDHATPGALASHLLEELVPKTASTELTLETLERWESALTTTPPDAELRARLKSRLQVLVSLCGGADTGERPPAREQLESASDDELFSFLDGTL
jgi:NADP-dependent 3-hydroxy acid dehydrogenase YdfG/acyl carrier protein